MTILNRYFNLKPNPIDRFCASSKKFPTSLKTSAKLNSNGSRKVKESAAQVQTRFDSSWIDLIELRQEVISASDGRFVMQISLNLLLSLDQNRSIYLFGWIV